MCSSLPAYLPSQPHTSEGRIGKTERVKNTVAFLMHARMHARIYIAATAILSLQCTRVYSYLELFICTCICQWVIAMHVCSVNIFDWALHVYLSSAPLCFFLARLGVFAVSPLQPHSFAACALALSDRATWPLCGLCAGYVASGAKTQWWATRVCVCCGQLLCSRGGD